MRGNVCWSDFSQPNPRLVHPGLSCHGCQSVVGATMRPLTNVGLYTIAHSMAVESVGHAELIFFISNVAMIRRAEAKCAIEQLRD
jgi:hypothetical protein